LILSAFVTGQTPENNTEISQTGDQQKNNLYRLYFESVTIPKEIINGKEYLPYNIHGRTTPLLFSGQVFNTTLRLKTREYKNIRLQYDTYLDELIYTDTSRFIDNQYPRIALNKDIIEGFSFFLPGQTMNFRYLKFPENKDNNLENGFYEIAYDGDTRLIIKHKSIQYNYQALNEYKYSPERYVLIGETFTGIQNNKVFLSMFGEKSGEISEFLKNSRIRIKNAGKDDLIKVLEYIDTIKNH
jgi:hypothetical protein